MSSVIVLHTSTVAVSTPLNGMPVPGVDRMAGFTMTMYAIVKNVVMPAITSRPPEFPVVSFQFKGFVVSCRRVACDQSELKESIVETDK
jgi:hypothetical protein